MSTSAKSLTCLHADTPIPTPREIVEYLDKNVIGQNAAKRRLAVAVYNHYKRVHSNTFGRTKKNPFQDVKIEKSNILMLGPTGTGKTFLLQNIAQFLGIPLYIQDCSNLTAEGYYGGDVEDLLLGLIHASGGNVANAQVGIVCLDEIDKNAARYNQNRSGRDINGESVQQELLKIVEGTKVILDSKHPRVKNTEGIEIDTTNILFIATGAFSGIEEAVQDRLDETNFNNNPISSTNLLDQVIAHDIVKYGFLPEFVGRFPIITHTNPIDALDLARIVSEPNNSILNQYRKLAYLDGINLSFSEDAILTVAQEAEISGTGARSIRAIFETVLNDFMFEAADLAAGVKSSLSAYITPTTQSHPAPGAPTIDFTVDRDFCLRVLHPVTYHTLSSSRAS